MRNLKITFILLLITNLAFSQNKHNKEFAKKIVENKLLIIYNYVNEIDLDTTLRRISAIDFLEQLTKIKSESDTWGQIGKLDPTESDYKKWKVWFEKNKELVIWDEKTKSVKIISLTHFSYKRTKKNIDIYANPQKPYR